jgi:hypothetical protein
MKRPDTLRIVQQAFEELAARFPHLHMVREEEAEVELMIRLSVQPGLKQQVSLYLANNDELNMVVDHFWLDWFPCTNPAKVEAYIEAVSGYLSAGIESLNIIEAKSASRQSYKNRAQLVGRQSADRQRLGYRFLGKRPLRKYGTHDFCSPLLKNSCF